MPQERLSFEQFDLSLLSDNLNSCKALENSQKGKKLNKQPPTHLSVGEYGKGGGEGLFSSIYYHEEEQQFMADVEGLHNLYYDVVSPQFQSCSEDNEDKLFDAWPQPDDFSTKVKPEKEMPYAASLEILTNHGCRLRRLNGEKVKIRRLDEVKITGIVREKLSTNEILKLAAQKFIHSSSSKIKNELSRIRQPNASSLLLHLDLSEEDKTDVELVLQLLSAAERVGERKYHKAKKLLKKCNKLGLDKGNPVQRLVHYFCGALRERVDRERGRCDSKGFGRRLLNYVETTLSTFNSTILAFQNAVPFCYVCQFPGMQVILERVEGERKVHIIDLQINVGTQYTALLQALAARSESHVEILKITAVGNKFKKEAIEATGRRLTSFALSFDLPFAFDVVLVEDILDLHESLFELDDDEAVAVYSEYFLMLMIEKPDRLEHLMGVIRNIDPCVMVIIEVEANHSSPVFVNRFAEALFYYGAFLDSLEDCLIDDIANKRVMESIFLSPGIQNILAAEEEERAIRHVKINVWREFFARFEMFEVEFSMSSVYQANLVLTKFSCGSSCTLEMDGKSLIVGWKGTPVNSLSAWIFN